MAEKSPMEQDLDDVERVARQLVGLLEDRQFGMMTWSGFVIERLQEMKFILDRLGVE